MKVKYAYPVKYVEPIQLRDGTILQIRPVHPTDGLQALAFRESLSDKSMYGRFLGYIPKVTEELIERFTKINYNKDMAIIAEIKHGRQKEGIAVARIASEQKGVTEFAVIVADEWQGKGLGKILTDYMIQVGKDLGYYKMEAHVFEDNVAMIKILKTRGFELSQEEENILYAEKDLQFSIT